MKLNLKIIPFLITVVVFGISKCAHSGDAPSPSPSVLTYTIDFDLNGGTSSSYDGAKTVNEFSKDVFFFDCVKEGYNFRGWSYNDELIFNESGELIVTPIMREYMTFVAEYNQSSSKIDVSVNIEGAGIINGAGEYKYGEEATLKATANKGYSFVGWYINGSEVSKNSKYKLTVYKDDINIEARFKYNQYNLTLVSSNPNLGKIMIEGDEDFSNQSKRSVDYLKEITVYSRQITDNCYFLGWYDSNNKLITTNATFVYTMNNVDTTLFAKWDAPSFEVEIIKNNDKAGNVDGTGSYQYNSDVTLTASNNPGYVFIGFFKDGVIVTNENIYTFSMPYGNYKLEAKWDLITYSISYELNGGALPSGETNPESYTIEDVITLKNPVREGYSFDGWYLSSAIDGNPIDIISGMTGDIHLIAKWTIQNFTVSVIQNEKGSVSGVGEYEYNSDVTLTATPNNGYKFKDWCDEDDKELSTNNPYTFKMPSKNITYKANYEAINYVITYELNDGVNDKNNPTTYNIEDVITLLPATKEHHTFKGWLLNGEVVSTLQNMYGDITLEAYFEETKYKVNANASSDEKGSTTGSGEYTFGTSVTVSATPNTDCLFRGWYDANDNLLTKKSSYTFTIGNENVNLTALFWTLEEYNYYVSIGAVASLDEEKNVITYGLYPQTVLNQTTEGDLITALNQLDETSIDQRNGYYLYNERYYVKFTASLYESNYTFDDGTTIVDGTTYWFKCEPIVWSIMKTNTDNSYYLMSQKLIDNQRYHSSTNPRTIGEDTTIYANSYKYSQIRAWLNGYDGTSYSVKDYTNSGFINTAFGIDFESILITEVDNSAATTKEDPNPRESENTFDKIFLPSYQDYLNTEYGFINSEDNDVARQVKTTDYARARGCRVSTSEEYKNNGFYWMRSPTNSDMYVSIINTTGGIGGLYCSGYYYCARPAMNFTFDL